MIPGQLSFAYGPKGDDPPPAQRHSRTSRAAAKAIQPHREALWERVLACIERCGPISDQAIAVTLGLPENTVRPRRIELVKAGLVIAAPDEVRTTSGRAATAWIRSEGR